MGATEKSFPEIWLVCEDMANTGFGWISDNKNFSAPVYPLRVRKARLWNSLFASWCQTYLPLRNMLQHSGTEIRKLSEIV